MSAPSERRRLQRVKLLEPLPAKIDAQRVFILDVSRTGMRVAHQESVGAPGERRIVELEWDGRRVAIDCTLTHSHVQRIGTAAYARSIYHSGFTIAAASPESEEVLRAMIAWHVERALDEQKANARGIPAAAAQCFQTGKGTEYLRFELLNGAWRRTATTRPDQPAHGFTISAEEDREHIEMLCHTFANSDEPGRKLIKMMAELSISQDEGIPTRRYTP